MILNRYIYLLLKAKGITVFIDFGWSDKAFRLYNPEGKLHVDNDLQLKSFGKILFKNLKIQSRVDFKPPLLEM